jgi:hypothetical protein
VTRSDGVGAWRLIVAVAGAGCAFVLVPWSESFTGGYWINAMLRVLLCAGVSGLFVRRGFSVARCVAVAGVAAVLGTVVLVAAYRNAVPLALAAAELATPALALVVANAARLRAGVAIERAMLAVVIVGFLWQVGVIPGHYRDTLATHRQRLAVEPADQSYSFDGPIFVKTVDLMKAGIPFYPAFGSAYASDARMSGPPPGKLNYRQRWLFEFWRALPGTGGQSIWWSYVVFSVVVMLAGYSLAGRFVDPNLAIIAPVSLFAYLSWPASTSWFPMSEIWGGGLAVMALAALARERWLLGAGLIVLAVAARELMIYLVPVFAIGWLVYDRRRDELAALSVVLVAPAALIAYHLAAAPAPLASGASLASTVGVVHGGPAALDRALSFSAAFVPPSGVWPRGAPALALAGALMVGGKWRRGLLLAATAVPLAALAVFSSGVWGYYWGGILTPVVLALAPLAAVRQFPAGSEIAATR